MRCVANNAPRARDMHITKSVLHHARLAHGSTATRRRVVTPVKATAAAVEKVLTGLAHGSLSAPSSSQQGTTKFDYLFDGIETDPSKHLSGRPEDVVKALTQLGMAMIPKEDTDNDADESKIPAIYTYWGQFLDHDMTANTDRNNEEFDITKLNLEPLLPSVVKNKLENLREPALNLDSVYGDGPFVPANKVKVPYVGIKFELGPVSTGPFPRDGELVPGTNGLGNDLLRDLPRRGLNYDRADRGRARIGDDRNDENLIVAQLHVAFLRFHNNAVDWVMANEPALKTDEKIFNRARDITRWTYQWIVVQDFLKTIAKADIVDNILNASTNILDLDNRGTYMPLEFSVAAYRFGHSMIRAIYDWNKNFGKNNGGPVLVLDDCPFEFLFSFTGKPENPVDRLKPPLDPSNPRPDDEDVAMELPGTWPADWARMVKKDDKVLMHFARRIDTKISPPLGQMANEGILAMMRQLAVRNLLRGYLLSLPTGQAVAAELDITPLTSDELLGNAAKVDAALTNGNFLDATPLWFYILKEAEVQSARKASTLGDVGSTIVASTIIAHIKHDPDSFLGQAGWTPTQGVKLRTGGRDTPVETIADFLRFAKVLD